MENLTSSSSSGGPTTKRPRKKAEEPAPSQPVAVTSHRDRRSMRLGRGKGPKPTTALERVSDSEEPGPSWGRHGRVRKRGKAPQATLPEDSSSSEAGPSRGRSSRGRGQGRGRGRGATTQTSLKHQESEEEEPRPSQIQHGRGRGRGRGGGGRSTSRTRATGRPRPGNLRNLEANKERISHARKENNLARFIAFVSHKQCNADAVANINASSSAGKKGPCGRVHKGRNTDSNRNPLSKSLEYVHQ